MHGSLELHHFGMVLFLILFEVKVKSLMGTVKKRKSIDKGDMPACLS